MNRTYQPYADNLQAHSGSKEVKESGVLLEGRSRSQDTIRKKDAAIKRKLEAFQEGDEEEDERLLTPV